MTVLAARARYLACWTICRYGLGARITCKVLLRAAGGALISIIIEIIICAHTRKLRHLESDVLTAPCNRVVGIIGGDTLSAGRILKYDFNYSPGKTPLCRNYKTTTIYGVPPAKLSDSDIASVLSQIFLLPHAMCVIIFWKTQMIIIWCTLKIYVSFI